MKKTQPKRRISSSSNIGNALRYAILVGIACAVPIGIGWYIMSFWLYLSFGGDLGGYGAAPSDPEPWVGVATTILLVAALVTDLLVARAAYLSRRHRS